MESGREDQTGSIPFGEYASSDLGIAEFMDNHTNLDQFIDDLIWEEDNALNSIVNFTSQVVDFDHQQNPFPPVDQSLFDFNDVAMNHVARNISPDCSTLNEFPKTIVETDEEESSSTTSNASEKKKQKKSDRSITLISERRRRSRMKEKLYALRSLVPTITKMDKASIIGDAVLYVQELQMQAKKLRSEIAGLDSSFTKGNNHYNKKKKLKSKKINSANSCSNPTMKKILKMDIIEVEEGELYARIVSKKEKGVAVLLYKALQSLTTFIVQTSNLATLSQNYVFTFTLHTTEEVDMNLPSLKMWITRAFLAQGFDFQTSLSA